MADTHLDDIADELHGTTEKKVEVQKPMEAPKPAPQPTQQQSKSSFPIIPIIVLLLIIGALYYAYSQGYFDSLFEKKDEPSVPKQNKTTPSKSNTTIKTVQDDGPPPLPDEFFDE